MFHYSSPGKQMIAGEWSVLENHKSIVAAVNKRVHAVVENADKINVVIDDFSLDVEGNFEDGKIIWHNIDQKDEKKLIFIKGSMEAVMNYVGRKEPFKIHTWGEELQLEISGKFHKIGFGSSAASVVAAVGAILDFYGLEPEKELVYKLSAIAHYYAQDKVGSGFDVAASTYGGVLIYKRFDERWFAEQMKTKSIKDVVKQLWHGFCAEPLEIPKEMRFLIGFTGSSASTKEMVLQMNTFKENHRTEYDRIYTSIGSLVLSTIDAWKNRNWKTVMYNLNKNQELLRELTKKSGVPIETDKLKHLHETTKSFGAGGKLSGGGGGDCGIALCFDSATAEKIKSAWKEKGIYIVNANIDKYGLRKE